MNRVGLRVGDVYRMGVIVTAAALLVSCSGIGESSEMSPTPSQTAAPVLTTPDLASGTTKKPSVHPDDALAVGKGTVEHQGLQVRVDQSETVSIAPSDVAQERQQEIRALAKQGVVLSHPLRIATDTGAGGQLTQRLAQPLPEEWEAGFLTFNENLQEWTAVPVEVSSDRSQLTAHVDHFSDWWHYLMPNEIGETMRVGWDRTFDDWSNPAETADYYVSDVLSVRVDQPHCSGEPPAWVSSTVFIEEHRNNPVHFCVGSSPQSAELLVVKVRVNRGFGMLVATAATPLQSSNTTYKDASAVLLDTVMDLGGAVATGLGPTLSGGSYLGAGQEITLVFDETSLRAVGDGPLVQLSVPDVASFGVSQLASALTELGLGLGDATSLAILGVAQCQSDLKDAASESSAPTATASCALKWLTDNWEDFGIPRVLPTDVLKRAGIYMQLFSAVVDVGAYVSTTLLDDAALRVSVTLTPAPRAIELTATHIGPVPLGLDAVEGGNRLAKLLGPPDEPEEFYVYEGEPFRYAWGGFQAGWPGNPGMLSVVSANLTNWVVNGHDIPANLILPGHISLGASRYDVLARFPEAESILAPSDGHTCPETILVGDGLPGEDPTIMYCIADETVIMVQGGIELVNVWS